MADQDASKNVSEQSGTPQSAEPTELIEDELKAVTGGLLNTMGANLSSSDTAVCVSSD